MNILGITSCILVLLALGASAQSRVVIDPEFEQENRCGGALEADSGSLTFPATGQVIEPGQICIWTIHLQTTSTVRLNFSSLDIIGDEEDCGDNAVRLYSLTNLIPAAKAESYTFCNSNPPTGGNFFLSGNLVTVVYRSSEEIANTGAGFTLNWEGISFQPIPKTHESTYTSATSGVIRYPIEGEYAPNQINTWLIKTSDTNPNLELQINVPYVNLENCSSPLNDPCLCDALILYEITDTGILKENTRFCGNSTQTTVEGLGPNFIVGFFTDHEDVDGDGSGFELIYKPRPSSTTQPPSTTPTTTPAPPASNFTTSCGGALFGEEGLISYRQDGNGSYQDFEKCFWTVRSPNHRAMVLTISPINMELNNDYIILYKVNQSGVFFEKEFTGSLTQPSDYIIDSSVVLVSFYSDHSYSQQYSGFQVAFAGMGPTDVSVAYYEDLNVVATEEQVQLKYPSQGQYQDLELSTFVIVRPTAVNSYDEYRVDWDLGQVSLEMGSNGQCKDKLHVYTTNTKTNRRLLNRKGVPGGLCVPGQLDKYPYTDALVLVLATDYQGRLGGFEVDWQLVRGNGFYENTSLLSMQE